MAIAPVTPFSEVDDWLYGLHFPELSTNRSHVAGSGAPRAADEFLAFRRRGRHWTQDSHDHHEPQPIARYLAEEGSDPRNGDDYPMTSLSDGLGREKETITP